MPTVKDSQTIITLSFNKKQAAQLRTMCAKGGHQTIGRLTKKIVVAVLEDDEAAHAG